MKLALALILALPLVYANGNRPRWVEVNRTLYVDSSVVTPSPYVDSVKVHEALFAKYARPIIDSGGCVLPVESSPEIKVLLPDGQEVDVPTYLKSTGAFSLHFVMMLDIDVSWTGHITKVLLKRYRGSFNKSFSFVAFAKALRATPATKFHFPIDMDARWVVSIPKDTVSNGKAEGDK